MESGHADTSKIRHLDVAIDRDVFVRTLIRHLSGTLEEIVGLKEASGFISIVSQKLGDEMNGFYRTAIAVQRLPNPKLGETDGREYFRGS